MTPSVINAAANYELLAAESLRTFEAALEASRQLPGLVAQLQARKAAKAAYAAALERAFLNSSEAWMDSELSHVLNGGGK